MIILVTNNYNLSASLRQQFISMSFYLFWSGLHKYLFDLNVCNGQISSGLFVLFLVVVRCAFLLVYSCY